MDSPNNRKFAVRLCAASRDRLEGITRNGTSAAKKILHARLLLMSDQDHPNGRYSDEDISRILGVHINTVARIRKRFVLDGEGPALDRQPRQTPPTPAKLDGKSEAMLVAICCSSPPDGRVRWTLSLLRDELISRTVVTSIARETIRKTLKKMNFNLGASSGSVSPNRIARGS